MTKITKKSARAVQLSLDIAPESKQLLETLRKKFGFKTKAQTLEIILQQMASQQKIPEFQKREDLQQILLGIDAKLDRFLERFENVL